MHGFFSGFFSVDNSLMACGFHEAAGGALQDVHQIIHIVFIGRATRTAQKKPEYIEMPVDIFHKRISVPICVQGRGFLLFLRLGVKILVASNQGRFEFLCNRCDQRTEKRVLPGIPLL